MRFNHGVRCLAAKRPSLRPWFRHLSLSTALASITPTVAAAQQTDGAPGPITLFGQYFGTGDVIQFAMFCGAMGAALLASVLMMRERSRIAEENTALRAKVASLTSQVNQLEAVATGDGQTALIWSGKDHKPAMIGKLDPGTGAPDQRASFLAFGRWFEPVSAARLEKSISTLREKAEPFSAVFETLSGAPLDVQGRTAGGSAVVRFVNMTAERTEHYRIAAEHSRLSSTLETLQALLDNLRSPVWIRHKDGRLAWVNKAYLEAIEKPSLKDVHAKSAELFGSQTLETMADQRTRDQKFSGSVSTVVHGDRVVYEATEIEGSAGSSGIAEDWTDVENVRRELSKTIRSHEETLDGLTTAVAMFDESQRLNYYNQSFRELWGLETAFLDGQPDMSLLLQHLRTAGKLPEQPDWQRWKNDIIGAYQALEPVEHWWHLPDNRTLRVLANPHPRGGLTWVFENLTERIDLESKYTTLMRVQSESLDHLSEGVAVFAADGHLELSNPAFAAFWGLEKLVTKGRIHISAIQNSWLTGEPEEEVWSDFAGIVTGFDEQRAAAEGRINLDDQILSWNTVPLPNGQTMLTFLDMTGPDQIERALRERNEALERTAHLRSRFIQHVSYELRSPLTNIMGFSDLLGMEATGPLNEKQSGYVGNISHSAQKLMQVTDDILDLATIDAGMFTLEIDEVDLASVMRAAADLVRDRFEEHGIELLVRVDPDVGAIHADPDSLKRVLVNILKNAAAYAPEGSSVPFTCQRVAEDETKGRATGVSITIRDQGPGMDADTAEQAFELFHTTGGGRTRGTGLGLSVARSFVTLHDGDIAIRSAPGKGTTVEIFLPETPPAARIAAQ